MADVGNNLAGRILAKATETDRGNCIALIEGDHVVTYGGLSTEVRRAAAVLAQMGVRHGDRVAVYSPDCVESVIALLGGMYIGAIVIPINELITLKELRYCLKDATVSLILVDETLGANVAEVRSQTPGLKTIVPIRSSSKDDFATLRAKTKISNSSTFSPAAVQASDPAILLYSAGVASGAKEVSHEGLCGVLHNHSTPVRAFHSFGQGFLGMVSSDRVFSTVRFFTAYGLGTGLLFPLLAGAQCFLMPEQARSSLVFEALREFKPTIFAATPSVYGQLARDADSLGHSKILATVRWCIGGAEEMPPKVIRMVRERLGSRLTVGYGMTEAFQFVIAGEAADGRPGCCGKALDGIKIRIVDDEGERVGVDEIGTLELGSETIVGTYLGGDATCRTDGWVTTLDRFMVDSESRFYHCGRADHLFKVGGKWVAPIEVESALLVHEAVWECAVIGANNEDGLIKPFAFVVPNIGKTPGTALEKELREYVKKELAPYKYPRWIEFVDELPKCGNGVVLRYKLRDRLRKSTSRRRAETGVG